MTIIPIWAATWELDCCHPDAEVGKQWEAPVTFRPETDPWWVTDHGAKASDEQRVLGLVGPVRRVTDAGDDRCIVEWHSLRFRMEKPTGPSPFTGRVYLDAHTDFGETDPAEGTVRGVVDRIEMIPIHYREREERFFVPAEQLPAIAVTSTLERDRIERRAGTESPITPELLIWLKID